MARLNLKQLGQRITEGRTIANLEVNELATDIDVATTQLTEIESGQTAPTLLQLTDIAETLHVPLSYFLDGTLNKGCPVFHPNAKAVEIAFHADLLPVKLQDAILLVLEQLHENTTHRSIR